MEEVLEFLGAYLIIYLFIWLFSIAYSITCYVMNSLGMYTIAKRRGIEKPWLAWIPVGSSWILGCISDQYRYVVKGENKSKRKILLGLNIGTIACVILFYVLYFVMIFGSMAAVMESGNAEDMAISMLGSFGGMMLLCIPMSALSIASSIFMYMAMYDLYTSCDPNNNVLFLLLSIFLGIHPFIIFFIRKKDGGMPPRREPIQTIPPQTGWQPPQQNPQPNPYQPPQYYWQPPQANPPVPGNDGGETTIL